MHAFGGLLTALVQSSETQGSITFEAKAKGLQTGKIVLRAQ
jgi:beta-galactosidase